MKSKCSDNIYYRSKDLTDDGYDLMERLNVFYSKKKKLENDIKKEKSRIRETPTLSTDADSRTDTNMKRLRDLSF